MPTTQILRELVSALQEPLAHEDFVGGWSEPARQAALRIANDAIVKIEAGEKCDAAYHFIRWLDHMGVCEGPLIQKVAVAQQSIPKHK